MGTLGPEMASSVGRVKCWPRPGCRLVIDILLGFGRNGEQALEANPV